MCVLGVPYTKTVKRRAARPGISSGGSSTGVNRAPVRYVAAFRACPAVLGVLSPGEIWAGQTTAGWPRDHREK